MRIREPHEHHPREHGDVTPGGGDANEADALRDQGAALLAAADEAINRALSQNSEEFLSQTSQMGGQ